MSPFLFSFLAIPIFILICSLKFNFYLNKHLSIYDETCKCLWWEIQFKGILLNNRGKWVILAALQIRPVNGQLLPIFGLWLSIFILLWSLWPVDFPRNLFYYYFLEIILNDLELIFLAFKHFQTQVYFLFICWFCTCLLIIRCFNDLRLFVLFHSV